MKRNNNLNQLSIFDIVLEPPKETAVKAVSKSVETKPSFSSDRNLCPYKIPSVKEIIKRIESANYRINKNQFIADVFECGAISISNTVDFTHKDEREETYQRIMQKYDLSERELIAELFGMIFALLSSVVYDGGVFDDYLGELFMHCNQYNKKTGQYFTPYYVSHFMAKTAIRDDVRSLAENDGIITICDPYSGGGGMLVGALDVLKNDYGINYTRNCFMEGADIDIRCVHMTYLQLSLAGVPAIVKHQNSLTRELWSVWKTPAFIFQYPRFRKYENLN